jgi:hypothetical protein
VNKLDVANESLSHLPIYKKGLVNVHGLAVEDKSEICWIKEESLR